MCKFAAAGLPEYLHMGVPYGQMQHLPQRFKTLRLILPEGFLKGANMAQADSKVLRLGVDVGSTTVKTVVLDPNTDSISIPTALQSSTITV